MGTNYYLIYENGGEKKKFHIGKASGGWAFIFSLQFLQVWKLTGNPLWEKIKPYWDRAQHSDAMMTTRPTPPELIPEFSIDDAYQILEMDECTIEDEYGNKVDLFEKFYDVIFSRVGGLTAYSYYTTRELEGNHKPYYYRDFCVHDNHDYYEHVFSSSLDFS